MLWQDSQRKGRKSSWPQYSYWQWRPIDSRSVSAICVKDSSLGEGLRPFDAVMGDMAVRVVWAWKWTWDLQGIDEAPMLEGPGTIDNRHVTNAEKLPGGLSKRGDIESDLVHV